MKPQMIWIPTVVVAMVFAIAAIVKARISDISDKLLEIAAVIIIGGFFITLAFINVPQ